MNKIIMTFATLTVIASTAFASLAGDYKLLRVSGEGVDIMCAPAIRISRVSSESLKIIGNDNLGIYFNADGSEGDLIISQINKGPVVHESHNTSHGEKYETTVITKQGSDRLELELVEKTKRLFVTTSKSMNSLSVKKVDKKLFLRAIRNYDEAGSSASDWKTTSECEYELK